MLVTSPRSGKVIFGVAVVATLLIALHLWSSQDLTSTWKRPSGHHTWTESKENPSSITHDSPPEPPASLAASATPIKADQPAPSQNEANTTQERLPCLNLESTDRVAVIMRTGATEIQDKLPAHLNTTFRCYPNLVIFSDFEEVFEGHTVHDVLKYTDQEVISNNEEFDLYRRLLEHGRAGLDDSELSGKMSYGDNPTGKPESPGWRLDKWKFLPMANMTLELYPDMEWYAFVETDTYLMWSNLLQFLAKLNPAKSLYYGSEVMIGDDIFAHGGSAFIMSKPALVKIAEIYNANTKQWNDFTAGHWAGDCVLGKALHDAGTDLTYAWPMFQGGNPSLMNWLESKGDNHALWCAPALSYHHLSPNEMRKLWDYEQNWIAENQRVSDGLLSAIEPQLPILHHREVFKSHVLTNLTTERTDWNNMSDEPVPGTFGSQIGDCRLMCEARADCMQYALNSLGCAVGKEAKFGRRESGAQSGWIAKRIEQWAHTQDKCDGKEDWKLS